MDEKLTALERRIDDYMQQCLDAEKIALQKLSLYPQSQEPLLPVDVLRRERWRHHTRSLMLKEIQGWIRELRGEAPSHLLLDEEEREMIAE